MGKALLGQSVKKAPGPNMLNFRILRVLWDWDPDRITSVVIQAIRLQYHPQPWETCKRYSFRKAKLKRSNFSKILSGYQSLKLLGQSSREIGGKKLSQFCKVNGKLHKS